MAPSDSGRVVLGITRFCVIAGFAVVMGTAFRTGWTHLSTDFPNYYTAAVLVRQGKPLRNYFDWTWFARQMNYAGIEQQIGAYTPQTPLTMLPMIGLAGLPPIVAKRVWLTIDLALLAAVVLMLARATGIRWEYIAILLFSGYTALAANFIDGQYYVFLLFLLTLTFYWFDRGYFTASGFLTGVAFGLKLYTGPLLFYFAAKRKWSGAAGMLAASACLGALSIALFGWSDIAYYLTHVLPRTLEGGSTDPYNPGGPSVSTLLHRLLVREPELNPNPALDAPWLFFFVRTAVRFGLIVFTALGVASARDPGHRRDFAWSVIALMLLSTSVSSYTFILLLVPIVLLLKDASPWKSAYLVGSYILLSADLKLMWLFPKVWLLLLLFAAVGVEYWRSIRASWAVSAAVAVLLLSLADARRHMLDYMQEPGRRYPQIAVEPVTLFSGYPAISRSGLFYQAMGDQRKGEDGYLLRWLHDNRIESLGFNGYALHPLAPTADGPIWFELVAHQTSKTMRFDPSTRTAAPSPAPDGSTTENRVVSPDGKWIAYTRETADSQQIWLESAATGQKEMLAGGKCNNSSPAWELDSSAIVFASDCGRAYGLPALYRVPIAPGSSGHSTQ